ncbi:MAG: Ig-like domain-containing protein [Eubacterium sp.]|nr:Ig-like domain-containing protein [Eubacterium sp.]
MESVKRQYRTILALILVFALCFAQTAPLFRTVQAAENENRIENFYSMSIKDENGAPALDVLKTMTPSFAPDTEAYTLTVPADKAGEVWDTVTGMIFATTNGDMDTIAVDITFDDGEKKTDSGAYGMFETYTSGKNLIPAEGKETVITLTTPASESKGLSAKTYTFKLVREVVKEENKITYPPTLNRKVEGTNVVCAFEPEFNADTDAYTIALGAQDSFTGLDMMIDQISSEPLFIMDYSGFKAVYEKADGTQIEGTMTWTGVSVNSGGTDDISPAPGESATLRVTTPETEKYGAKTYTWTFVKEAGEAPETDGALANMIVANQDGRDISGYLIPGFSSGVKSYTLAIPQGMALTALDVQGILADGNSAEISGKLTLADGKVLEGSLADGHLKFDGGEAIVEGDATAVLEVSVPGQEGAEDDTYTLNLKREAFDDTGDEEEIPEDIYFLTEDNHKVRMDENRTFTLDQNAVGHFVYNKAGAEDLVLDWQNSGSDKISIYADQGDFEATGVDENGVDAWVTEQGQGTHLADFKVRTVEKTYADFRLKLDDSFVSVDNVNMPYSIQGDTQKKIDVYALVKGEEDLGYRKISSRYVDFSAAPEGIVWIYNQVNRDRGTFRFSDQDKTAVVTAKLEAQPELTRSFQISNVYVPVTGIRFHLPEVFYMDKWNSLKDQWVGIKEAGAVYPEDDTTYQIEVQPANATNKNVTIENDNQAIFEWQNLHGNGIVPNQRGEVTFKVTSVDNPEISVEKTVRFEYKYPLEKLTMDENQLTVKEGDTLDLDLSFAPENTSEKRITWSYDQEGIVGIDSNRNGTNTLTAVSAGTVQVTGTPVDDTNNLDPITFTVTVEGDGSGMPDVSGDVDKGIGLAQNYLKADSYSYGDEWTLFALVRSGYALDEATIEAYYKTVEDAAKAGEFTGAKVTDLERLALTLDAIGKDATDVGGVNLIEMLANTEKLDAQGSNGLAFGLLAMDGKKYEVSENAKWNRDAIIEALKAYQNDDGGFTLSVGSGSGVDMTAMVLQALAKYQDRADVKAMTDKALDYLRNEMSFKGTFSNGSTESAAQVLTALTELKIDPMDPANGFTKGKNSIISGLMANCVDGEGFAMYPEDGKVNAMSTQQALYSLAAYKRFVNGENSLYDLGAEVDEDKTAAQNVINIIGALPQTEALTLEDKALVEAARAAYDALSDAQKAYVDADTLKLLTDAEDRIAALEADQGEGEKPEQKPEEKPGEVPADKDQESSADGAATVTTEAASQKDSGNVGTGIAGDEAQQALAAALLLLAGLGGAIVLKRRHSL